MNEISSSKFMGVAKPVHTPTQDKANKTNPSVEETLTPKIDKFETSKKKDEPVTYSNLAASKKLEPSDIEALMKDAEKATENLRKLVEKLILKQNKNYEVQDAKGSGKGNVKNINHGGEISQEAVNKAKLSIAEDGEYGVKAVSDRLVDFAIAVSGGDKTKLETLKSAIDAGFAAAKESFGGELPEICNQTYTETMRKLDEWSASDLQ